MDLTKLTTADLLALQKGDLKGVSTQGLQMLQSQGHDERAASDRAQMAQEYAPTAGMGTVERLRAGIGQGMTNVARGAGQLVGKLLPDEWDDKLGLPTQASVDESKRLDAPLLQTTAGRVGSVTGNVAAVLPAAFIPGVNGYAGAAAVGGITGALQPVASDESRLANTALGAAAGPLGVGVARGAAGVVQAGRALLQPFTAAGRDQIAGNALARFAENPANIRAGTSAPTVTGAVPTLAEQTGDAGIARLQDAVRALDPQFENAIGRHLMQNNAARVNSLQRLAGADGGRDFAVAERAGTAGPMYDDAFNVSPGSLNLSPEQTRTITTLMRSPAVRTAQREAQAIASNSGSNVGPSNASGSIEGLHNMKMALDDAIQTARTAGQTNKAASIETARNNLVGFIESVSPEYASARGTYAQMSQPINSMDIAGQVARRALSNGSDLEGNQTINRNALLGLLRDEPGLMRQATGRNVGQRLGDVMAPEDENVLRTIASEVDRTGAVAAAGNGAGSATAQRMASGNVLRALMGPLGSPGGASERWSNAIADSVLGRTAASPLNIVYGRVAEPGIQQRLAQALIDPDAAREVLAAAQRASVRLPPNILQRLAITASRVGPTEAATTERK